MKGRRRGAEKRLESLNQSRQKFRLSALEVMIGSLIFLGIIYIGYLIFFEEDGGSLAKLDKRVKSLESNSLQQMDRIQGGLKGLQAGQAQLEVRLKALEVQQKNIETSHRDLAARVGKPERRPLEERKSPASPSGKSKISYKVKPGDNLYSIARKYKVSTPDLIQWNKWPKNKPVKAGDTLIIFTP